MLAQKQSSAPGASNTTTSLPEIARPITKQQHYWNVLSYQLLSIWEKVTIVLLALVSIKELSAGVTFIVRDYPQLQADFQNHLVNTQEMTALLTSSIGLMMATMINILFAIRLTKAQERFSRILELLLATSLIIWYPHVLAFLQAVDYTSIGESLTLLRVQVL